MHLYSKVKPKSAHFYSNAGRDAVLPLNSIFLSSSFPSRGWLKYIGVVYFNIINKIVIFY